MTFSTLHCFRAANACLAATVLATALGASAAWAGDWPTYRYDAGRSADAPHALPASLQLQWAVDYGPRQPVWDDPLNQDLMKYDRSFSPVVAEGLMFIGFNEADKVVALDAATGDERWTRYLDGPVRLPPAYADGRLYVVCDDGYLYCLAAADGAVAWKFRGGPTDLRVIGNQRLISAWPARGGAVVAGDTVYFAASIWPFMGTFIYALDAASGDVRWVNDGTGAQFIDQPHNYPAFAGVAPQGILTVADDKLLIPGGRSAPAAFNRHTGQFDYFHLAKFGKYGGSSVFARNNQLFIHERADVYIGCNLATGQQLSGVRGGQPVLADEALYFSGSTVAMHRPDDADNVVWELPIDSTGDLIKSGNRLYAAGDGQITAIELPSDSQSKPKVAWQLHVEGEVDHLLAAHDRLYAVTLQGRILAFGADAPRQAVAVQNRVPALRKPGEAPADLAARKILDTTGVRQGYALFWGVGDGALLEAVAVHSDLNLVAIDPDAAKLDGLRRKLAAAGLPAARVALLAGTLDTFELPPYMASLAIVGDAAAAGIGNDAATAQRLFHSLRPYGGVAWLGNLPAGFAHSVRQAELANAEVSQAGDATLLTRVGALPGAGTWTHQYGDVANTVKSDDQLVKLPLGLLWFGGSSNMDVLPRHGHGPPEQIIGGRLFIQGMDCLSARDVYTGRVLWKVDLDDPQTFGVYYDETYFNDPLTLEYNQVHIPGSNVRGTNFVATEDRVYIIDGPAIRVLDVSTGDTLQRIRLPDDVDSGNRSWGYLGVYDDALIAGVGMAQFSERLDLPHEKDKNDTKSRWRFEDYDRAASIRLVVMDRYTGQARWSLDAEHGFLHNAVVAAQGRLFCLDKLPPNVEAKLARRGQASPDTYRLMALDLRSGQVVWQTSDEVFGTWLGVSAQYNVLLQSTRPSNDMVRDETGKQMIAYQADSGSVLWRGNMTYNTPPILHHQSIIAGGRRFNLLTGEIEQRLDPLTGLPQPWTFTITKGCGFPIGSENLLTFRSSAAGFFDLTCDSGTGHFGGFKSGCTPNQIAADGVLNAPDYTRTCRCSFQNQTSLALVHMPELEIWTHGEARDVRGRIRRLGINFGAPGDRQADNGTLWLDHPSVGGPSPKVSVAVDGAPHYFRHHASRVVGGSGHAWVAASGVEQARTIQIQLDEPLSPVEGDIRAQVNSNSDNAEESVDTGTVVLTSSDLELTRDKAEQVIGIRFDKLPIPRGAKIAEAYVQFTTKEKSTEDTRLTLAGEAADRAAPFEKSARNVSARPLTEARVAWQPEPWNFVGESAAAQQTPNLAAVLQEIVDRPAWQPGSAIALIISGQGKRVAKSYKGDARNAPRLVVRLVDDVAPPAVPSVAYTVRLTFLEPNPTAEPNRFDVRLQGQTMLEGFDVAAAAGGPLQPVTREFRGVPVSDLLTIELVPHDPQSGRTLLSGVEVIAEE